MLTTVSTGRAELSRYGLGTFEIKLPKGVSIWGHLLEAFQGLLLLLEVHLEVGYMLAVSLNNSDKADGPDPYKNILLAECSK